jgi:hypothetical protein
MQSAMKGKACDILGAKEGPMPIATAQQVQLCAILSRRNFEPETTLLQNSTPKGSRLAQALLSRKKLKRKAANVNQHIMEEHQKPEEAVRSGQEHLESATGDLKELLAPK